MQCFNLNVLIPSNRIQIIKNTDLFDIAYTSNHILFYSLFTKKIEMFHIIL